MSKQDVIEVEGVVLESLPNAMFKVELQNKHTILAPFNAVDGLGDSAAKQIVAARSEAPFLSKEDLQVRGKVSQKIMDFFENNNVLEGMPDQNQLSLF